MQSIDLRSDTVSHPTQEMREAMAMAEVGDDVYGDDPTVNHLEQLAAKMMAKEAAMFVPSGTMGNLAAVLAHCQRGDEIILGELSHTFLNEAGGVAAIGGIQPRTLPNEPDGSLAIDRIIHAIRKEDPHYPVTRLICLENTHNVCGGAALAPEYMQTVGELAASHGLALHLDGARIFNAAAALGIDARRLAEAADSVTFCLSKALCAPVGSILCGGQDFIRLARRMRKQLGGAMRQAGILAAAGIVALEKMVDRLAEDHQRASMLADRLRELPGLALEYDPPVSNMVYIRFEDQGAQDVLKLAHAQGIKLSARDSRRMRLVTHYWIDDAAVDKVVQVFAAVLTAS
jgi:threonine aldolase